MTYLHKIQKFVRPALAPISATLTLLAVAGVTHAQFTNPLGNITLYDFLLKILNSLIYILFPVIIIMMVYTGFLFVAAQGNETKLQEAKRALVWTVIGALIVLGSKALALAIKATINSIQN